MKTQSKTHLAWVDIMKGILIFLVIFGHSLQGIVGKFHLQSGSIYAGMRVFYGFHMAAFFFVAGFFVINWVKRSPKVALMQKVHRLVVPYFVWSFITASAMQLAGSLTNNQLGLKDFMMSPFMPFSEYWFLYVLFFIFIVYYAVVHNLNRGGRTALLVISLILYAAYTVMPNIWIFDDFSKYLLFFIAGTYVLEFKDSIVKTVKTPVFLGVSAILFVVVNIVDNKIIRHFGMMANRDFYLVTAIIGTALVMSLSLYLADYKNGLIRYIEYLGRNSMQFYVMHLVFLAGLRIVLIKIFGAGHLWMIAIVITFASLLLCSIGLWIIRKMKLSKILF